MVTQAPVNGRTAEPSAAEGVSRNLSDFIDDVASLAEMQVQLLNIDAREAVRKSIAPGLGLVGAVVFSLGTIPILLMSIAWCLTRADIPLDLALLMTFGGAVVIAGGVGWLSWNKLSEAVPIALRSMDELRQNLRWVRHAIKRRRRMPDE